MWKSCKLLCCYLLILSLLGNMLPVTALAAEQQDVSPAPDTSEFEEILPVEPEADPALNVSIVGEEISGRSEYAKEIFSPTASTWRPSRPRPSTSCKMASGRKSTIP